MSTDSLKICPICDFSNPATSILCGNPGCFADLTQISITHPVAPAVEPSAEEAGDRLCENGHPLEPEDELCLECGAPPAEAENIATETEPPILTINGHELGEMSQTGADGREIFLNLESQRRTILFPAGYEPDNARGERLAELERDDLPRLLETGRLTEADDRHFEVWTTVQGDPLKEIPDHAEALARRMAVALTALHEGGLVCRGLTPDRIVMTGENGFHLRDLDAATLADFGVTLRTENGDQHGAHFLAPEAAVGRYEEASDWWALGMILLRCLTRGNGIPPISADAFLLQLITRGMPIPGDIDPDWQHVLKGLLTRNPAKRWRGGELIRWFDGARNIPVFYMDDGRDKSGKVPISIGDQTCHTPEQWALAAASANNWEDAKLQLSRGVLTTWLEDIETREATLETVGRYRDSLVPGLGEDENLLLVLLTLNDQLPLIWKGEVVTPEWLLTHAELALGWLEGNLVKELDNLKRIDWLTALARRLERAETLCRELAIEVDRPSLRAAALVSDPAILSRRWKRRRRNFPRAHHRGLEVLCEKSAPLPEELLVLLSADLSQFTTAEAILEDAAREAETARVDFFCAESAREWVGLSQRDLILELNRRIANFSRCGIERLDEWADTFRYERLIVLPRILVLLQVPETQWKAPPQQAYLRNLFEFFHKRILAGIQRGALMNLRVSVNSRNIDLTELDGENQPASRILDHLIRREKGFIAIDPRVFVNQTIIERRIRRLTRVAADYYRDTGIASLYLGYPFLVIRPSSSSITARPKRAPLFLWPLRIETSGAYTGRVRVAFDKARHGDIESAGIELNPALQPLLKGEEVDALRGALAEALSRSGIDHAAFYELCQEALCDEIEAPSAELEGLPQETPEVDHGAGILMSAGAFFICDFSQQTISQDIRQLQGRPLEGGALATLLRATESEAAAEVEPEKVAESDKFFILPADPSQERAVFQARDQSGVVVQGPPGTGKSQTIVNILADCIGRGEKALVVCQKHAALEVVTRRMTEEGLGDRFFMVEDARRSRQPIIRALRTQVEAKAAWRTNVSDQSRLDLGRVVERLEEELTRGAEAIHAPLANSGLTYAEVMDELIQLGGGGDDECFAVRELFAPMSWVRVREIAARVAPLIELWSASRYAESPWRECRTFSTDDATLKACRRNIEQFAAAEKARNDLLERAGKLFDIRDADAFRKWESRFAPWLKSLTSETVADAHRWRDHWLAGRELEEQLNALKDEAGAHKKGASFADFGSLLADCSTSHFNELLKAKRKVTGKSGLLPKLNPFYWVARKKISGFLDANGLTAEEDGLFQQIDWEQQRRKLWRRLCQIETQLDEKDTTSDTADPNRIAAVAEDFANRWRALDRIGESYSQCPVASDLKEAFSAGTPEGIEAFFNSANSSLQYGKLREASLAALEPFGKWFTESFISNCRLDCEGQKISRRVIEHMTEHLPLLESAIRFKTRSEQLDADEAEVIDLLGDFSGDEPGARAMLEREALLGWKAEAEVKHPELSLDSSDFDKKVKRLEKTVNELRNANKSRLKRPWRPDLIANATRWMEILRLRGPRAKSIREVLDAGWDYGLFDLRPVWLANPETVSRIFPLREGLFDVVIFDEASQIPVEMAIPSLYRGKRAVISGDRKQLPPTNFFRSDLDEEEDSEFFDSLDDEALREDYLKKQQARREVKDCDDLLQLAEGQLPDCLLSVHYRSRWRHLIAFSNSGFYEGKLSVPVHHPDESIRSQQPIEVRHVGGTYREQTNPDEAEAVVNYLDELWRDDNPPSAGVVTFNLKQAELIEDLIEQRMIDDEDFRRRHDREQNRGGLDCLFVRNLENVQGDERDIIIFSTTFGQNPKGKFLRNFGPAGQRGGQRRLNVAVTRSKTKMVIFTSMPLNDIAANLPGDGSTPREILKSYLCYGDAVSRGEFEAAEGILHRLEGEAKGGYDPAMFAVTEKRVFVREVFDFLEQEGLDPRYDESTDAFHYDIGVPDPATGRFGLAIECDPPVHPELTSAAARELWRPALLKGTIPKVIRLWSREWFEDNAAEKERLLKACRFGGKKKKKAKKKARKE